MISTDKQNLNWIGIMCKITSMPKLEEHTYSWIFRIVVLDLALMKHDYKMFCYSPADVNPTTKTVEGLVLEGTEFKKVTLPIPLVNYDYHFGETDNTGKPGFTYSDFEPWALENGYKIYPERSLRKLANDKLETAKILSQCDEKMIPYTEPFQREHSQLSKFLHKNAQVFIKPRFGSSGNGIFIVNKAAEKFKVDFYNQGQKNTRHFSSLSRFLASIQDEKYSHYIIQEGVNCIRHQERVFDIRVVMCKDVKEWLFISEVRLGAKGKEISNLSQGGDSYATIDLLKEIFPEEKALAILEKIRNTAEKLATFINNHLDDKVVEIALDVLVDTKENIHLAELNIKPGLCGGFAMYDNFFNMSESEKYNYETLAKKHGEHLAKSLLHRARRG